MSVKFIASTSTEDFEAQLEGGVEEVLTQLEGQGKKFPFGCRSGSCAVCRAEILEGEELLETPGATESHTLSEIQAPDSVRLLCRAKIKAAAQGSVRVTSVSDRGS